MFGLDSPEVKACLDALKAIEAEHSEIAMLGLSKKVRGILTKGADQTKISIREEGLSPKGLVWMLVSNVIDPELSYGHHHIYRGVLGMRGKALLALWDTACAKMTSLGVHDAAEEAKEKAYIRRQIAAVG